MHTEAAWQGIKAGQPVYGGFVWTQQLSLNIGRSVQQRSTPHTWSLAMILQAS